MAIFSVLACFRPSPSSSPRKAYEAAKKRWVGEQIGLILAARARDACGYGYNNGKGKGNGAAVDVSRYGGINLELALSYEFDRRWWFAQTTRLIAAADDEAMAAAAAGKTGGVKFHPLVAAGDGEKP